jgi:hypothetical protein
MQHFDLYTPIAAILFFTFLTTLRFSFSGHFHARDPISRIVTNPAWLYPLILSGPYMLGAYYHGAISPWPPQAFAIVSAQSGFWAGVATAIAAATADVWLLWATATTFRRFSPPHDARVVKYYYVANLAVGGYLMARFFHVIDMGNAGIIPS